MDSQYSSFRMSMDQQQIDWSRKSHAEILWTTQAARAKREPSKDLGGSCPVAALRLCTELLLNPKRKGSVMKDKI
jgi:hypothetical protein